MLGSIAKTFKKIIGSKADRDLKEIMPTVERIKAVYPSLAKLSNDELRNKTSEFKNRIQEHISKDLAEAKKFKEQAEAEENVDLKEELYKKGDEIEDGINDKIEVVLDEILPEAFAVVKETAKRFVNNETIKVTASDLDRDFAAQRDSIEIEGDQAIWHNRWNAAGIEVVWDMVHYDVQLFGGVVLHKGQIAEMATGEGKTLVATLPV